MAAHAAIKAALERARSDKVLGSSLQSSVVLSVSEGNPKAEAVLRRYADELDALFVVSSVEIVDNTPLPKGSGSGSEPWSYEQEIVLGGDVGEGGAVIGTAVVLPPKQAKCPRCWRYVAPAEDTLCERCADVVDHT